MDAKQRFNRRQFTFITDLRRGGVGVDMINLFDGHPGTANSDLHGPTCAVPVFRACGQVISICAGAVAHQLGQPVAPARAQRFDHNKPGAFSHHKTIAVTVKGREALSGWSLEALDSALAAANPAG